MTLKFQSSSTKLQINLKFQYPMTKTFTSIAALCSAYAGPKMMMPLGKYGEGSSFGILNLGHWNLFVIWFLELGIFLIFFCQLIIEHQSIAFLSITEPRDRSCRFLTPQTGSTILLLELSKQFPNSIN
jgi:hypothetical protein